MKNKKLLVVLALVLMLTATVVSAYMRKQTETMGNTFTPAAVSCSVFDRVEDNEKTIIQITNTGNYKAYLRVRLVTYWIKEDGSVAYRPSATIPDFAFDNTKWVRDANNNTYYYKSPVESNVTTENLLDKANIALRQETEDGVTYRQVIDVFAEAIIAETLDETTDQIADVESAWGVTVDSSGNIIKVN